MEDFIVSARKYRPQTFETVVGQAMITQTLERSIAQHQMAQAFLFCGPRGVGKTTCARIFARAVNDFEGGKEESGSDYAFNIFELDAASNNGVDDIRGLIDQVRIPPQMGKYKVYIIDEVHMLSTSAFNAFLKTLEEPPPYAIFILATTEKHKVLPTILSRCQIFDFQRIKINDMVVHLQGIAGKEGIQAEPDALHIIAEKADGAMRDALTIFDQIAASSGNKITYQAVIDNLNILDYDYYFDLVDTFVAGDKSKAIVTFGAILDKGFDGHNFINGLSNHFRALFFAIDPATAAIMEAGENVKKRYLQQAKRIDTRLLLNALHVLSETDVQYKTSRNARLLVEIALLKLCALGDKMGEKKNTSLDLGELSSGEVTPTVQEISSPVAPAILTKPVEAIKVQPSIEPLAYTPTTERDRTTELAEEPKPLPPKSQPEPVINSEIPKSDVVVEPAVPQIKEEKSSIPATTSGLKSKLAKFQVAGMPSLRTEVPTSLKIADNTQSAQNGSPDSAAEEKRPKKDFDLQELWKVWDSYAQQVKIQDRSSYFATLNKHQPIMREKYHIEFLVDNHVQKGDMDTDKTELLGYLRNKLENWDIQLTAIIDDQDSDDGESLYEPIKKFEAMSKDNPVLETFRKRFDLDVDYDS